MMGVEREVLIAVLVDEARWVGEFVFGACWMALCRVWSCSIGWRSGADWF